MPSAKFVADFQSVFQQIEAAEASFRGFERTASQVDRDLSRFGQSFSGAIIIGQGKAATATIDGLASSTQKLTSVTDTWAGRATVSDEQVRKLGVTTGTATNAFGQFHSGLNQVDRTLASLGINIDPQVRALDEMSAVAGKTASGLGLVSTAALSLGALAAGWQLGRMVSEFFELDRAIGDATAKLLGFGDVAGESAGARMDLLARASEIAGRAITNFGEAQRIVTRDHKDFLAGLSSSGYQLEKIQKDLALGERQYRAFSESQRASIAAMLDAGVSVSELAKAYKVQDGAIQALITRQKLSEEQERKGIASRKEATAAVEKLYAAEMRLVDAYRSQVVSVQDRLFGNDLLDRAKKYYDAVVDVGGVSAVLTEHQGELRDVMFEAVNALIAQGRAADPLVQKYLEIGSAANAMSGQIVESMQQAADAVEATVTSTAAMVDALVTTTQQRAMSLSDAVMAQARGQGTLTGTVQGGGPFTGTVASTMAASAAGRYFGPVNEFGDPDFSRIVVRDPQNAPNVSIHIDARESMYDTPDGVQRMADKVEKAVLARFGTR